MNTMRILAASMLILGGSTLSALADTWIGGVLGDWNAGANWQSGAVPNGIVAEVTNGVALVSNTVPSVTEAWAGNSGQAGHILVTNGGTLPVTSWLVVGRTGTGGNTPLSTMTVVGGAVNKSGTGALLIGDGGGCAGRLEVGAGGAIQVNDGSLEAGVGWGAVSRGVLILRDNGVVNLVAGKPLKIGHWGDARGACYLQDNARISLSQFWLGMWDNSIGVLWQSGGAISGSTSSPNEWTMAGELSQSPNTFAFYNLSGGSMNNPNNFQVGRWGKGVIYQTGGTNNQGGWCAIGRMSNSWGVVHIAGGRFVHNGGGGTHFIVAEQGRGELTVSGDAVVDNALSMVIGHGYSGASGAGFANLNGGLVRAPFFERWGTGSGYLRLNGGVIQAASASGAFLQGLNQAHVYPGGAVFDTAGFDITVNQPLLAPTGGGVAGVPVNTGGAGYIAPPIVSISGGGGFGATAVAEIDPAAGTVTNVLITCPGRDYSTAPAVALIGGGPSTPAALGAAKLAPNTSGGLTKRGAGVLTLGGANSFAGSSLVSGGTLRAGIANALSATAGLEVALGARFDLNNNNQAVGSLSGQGLVTLGSATLACGGDGSSTVFSGVISGAGGLIKNGLGLLTLSGANTYGGPTVVNEGILAATTATVGAGDVTLADGTGLAVQVQAANAQLRQASLTLAGASALLDFDLGAFGNPAKAPLDVAGAFAVNGAVTVNIAAANLAVGQFPLIRYGARAGAGSFALGALPSRVLAQIVTNADGASIDLKVLSFESPKWSGVVPGGVWDIGATFNWVGASSGAPSTYLDGDLVLFDDSASGTTTVNLVAGVRPAGVTLNNSALGYSLAGAGKIGGPAGLTKNGAGLFTLGNTGGNDYSGPTTVNSGTLAAGAPNALSSNSPVQVNGGTLDIQGYDQDLGALTLASGTLAGGGGVLRGVSYDLRGGAVTARLGGVGALTKSTAGTVTLGGANDHTGPTLVNAGILAAAAANVLSPNSAITIDGGGLDLQGNNQSAGAVTLVAGNIAGAATLTAPSFNVQDGTIDAALGGPGAVVKSGGGAATVNGSLGHAGQVVVNGGTLVLRGGNSYAGDTVVNGGSVLVSTDSNLGSGNVVLNPGGALRVDGAAGFASGRNIAFGVAAWNGGTFDVAEGSVALFSGAMTGAGGDTYFFKEGAGEMVYAGSTAFNDGTHFFVNRGTLVLSNATMSVNRWSGVASAAGADGTLALVGNSALTVAHDFNIGDVTPSRARFYLADNARLVCNAFDIGKPATCAGAAYQTGGSIVNAASWVADWRIGGQWGTTDVGAYGFYLLAGGAMTNMANNWQVGAYAQGVYYQTEGVNLQGGWAVFGRYGGAPSSGHGVGYLTGGQFIHGLADQHLIIGEQGRGEFTVAGSASVDLASALWVGLDYGSLPGHGTVNLNGGTLAAPAVSKPGAGATAILNFSGGTLKAKANEPNFIAGLDAVYVYPGGAVIDSGACNIAVPQALLAPDGDGVAGISVDNPGGGYLGPPIVIVTGDGSGATAVAEIDYQAGTVTNILVASPGRGYSMAAITLSGGGGSGASATAALAPNGSGGLTKLGTGTLTLSGPNTFKGPVRISQGQLVHDGQFGQGLTVEAAGALDLGPGIEDLSVDGPIALSGTLFLDIDRDNPVGADLIFGAPSVSLGGRLVVRNLGSAPQLGDAFMLIDAASYSGTFSLMELPPLAPGLAWDIPALVASGVLAVREAAPQTIGSFHRDSATGYMDFEFTGNPGYTYYVQATTNLNPVIVWETLSTNVADLVTGLFRLTDTNAPAFPRRFYRTIQP